MGPDVYLPDHKQPIPSAVLSSENFGRVSRLLEHTVPVTVSLAINTEFTGDHEQGYNTIAEIPGADTNLKDQVVMVGGHLDSWIAGTGATDDGAGAIIAMEAMRILTALHVQPRRTIRIALWSGEEQGDFGSLGYVHEHFGTIGIVTRILDELKSWDPDLVEGFVVSGAGVAHADGSDAQVFQRRHPLIENRNHGGIVLGIDYPAAFLRRCRD